MKILELFAGSRSIGRASKKIGDGKTTVFSVDWEAFDDIDLVMDIGDLKITDVPFVPDVIWSSQDCTTYSMAAISHHRNGLEPKTEYAKKCDVVNIHVISLIKQWLVLNPNMMFYMENPRAMLRKMPFMQEFERTTVWQCVYGNNSAKPTDIFSNNIWSMYNLDGWQPRPECFNGNKKCHHESAPRGSRTGTQGKKGSYDRSRIPEELCIEILEASFKKFMNNKN